MIRLEPMSEVDFEGSLARSIVRHAADSVRRGLWTEAAALEESRAEFTRVLPRGRQTPHYNFRNVLDETSGSRIGETWFVVQQKGGKTQFWIDWIWIDPPYRRRGYATEILRLLEDEAVGLGAGRVALNVDIDNDGAMALYAKVGYETTNLYKSKTLSRRP